MQVTFLTHIRQIPGGSVGSIVRLTSLDNAKSALVRGRTVALHRSRSHDGRGAMSAVEDPGAELTPAELRNLRRLAAFMVPASAEYGVPGADDEAIFADIVRSLGREDPAVSALGRAVLQCYYRDDRVMRALGLEPRPPYPKGRVLEQGDWSLLDAVRGRPRMWSDVDGLGN